MNDYMMNGPGYSIRVPAEFVLIHHDPEKGRAIFKLMPESTQSLDTLAVEALGYFTGIPTPWSQDTGASVTIHPLYHSDLESAVYEQSLWENPQFHVPVGTGLGIPKITGVSPVRQEKRLTDTIYLRDIEGYNLVGTYLRLTHVIVKGEKGGAECFIIIGIAVWPKYIGKCLGLIGGIDVSGGASGTSILEAVIDRSHTDQVEYHLRNKDGSATPLTSLPTVVNNQVIINIDKSIKTGNIEGTGIVVGNHSISRVRSSE